MRYPSHCECALIVVGPTYNEDLDREPNEGSMVDPNNFHASMGGIQLTTSKTMPLSNTQLQHTTQNLAEIGTWEDKSCMYSTS